MNKKKKAEKKDAKAEDSPTGYKDHPRRSASRNPVGTQPQSGSFLSFLSPDTLNGLISIIAYRLLLSVSPADFHNLALREELLRARRVLAER